MDVPRPTPHDTYLVCGSDIDFWLRNDALTTVAYRPRRYIGRISGRQRVAPSVELDEPITRRTAQPGLRPLHIVRTTRNSALPLIIRAYASPALSNG